MIDLKISTYIENIFSNAKGHHYGALIIPVTGRVKGYTRLVEKNVTDRRKDIAVC